MTLARLDNRWKQGRAEWSVPPLPAALLGTIGASFQRATFAEDVGTEVFLVLLESASAPPRLGWPVELRCKAGVAETSHGPLVFFLWSLVQSGTRIAWYEQFLNPQRHESRTLIGDAARQAYLKVAMVDSAAGGVLDIAEFSNVFIEATLVDAVGALQRPEDSNFHLAAAEFMRDHSVEALLDEA